MKLIALGLMLFLAGVQLQDEEPQEEIKNLVNIAKKCEDEKKPNQEALSKVDQGQEIEDESVKEYLVCLLDNAGLLDDKGNLVDGEILDTLADLGMAPEAVVLVEKECDKEGKDKKETALKFSVCIVRALNTIERGIEDLVEEQQALDSNKK